MCGYNQTPAQGILSAIAMFRQPKVRSRSASGTSDLRRGLIEQGQLVSSGPRIMRKKTALCAAVALAMTMVAVSVWHFGHVADATASLRGGWKPEPPEGYSGAATIWISCERGNEFGPTTYPLHPLCPNCEVSDLAPEPAIFAHCRPEENFNYDVESTKSEIADSIRRPEVSFALTDAGLPQDAFINRSSGSKSLDQKVLAIVVNRKYKATRCGSCRVFVAPPVNLKKEIR